MRIKKLAANTAFVVAIVLSISVFSHSTTLFSDNFDTDANATTLNFAGLQNWIVSDGTIDYIKNGGYGINCFGNAGGCLDMDGSTGNAGKITSKSTFNLGAGLWYYMEGQVSGNQRGHNSVDAITFGFLDEDTNLVLGSATWPVAYSDPFSLFWIGIMSSNDRTVRLFVEGSGNDNIGPILDSVTFRDDQTVVPEPASLILLGTGLGVIGLAARRRKIS